MTTRTAYNECLVGLGLLSDSPWIEFGPCFDELTDSERGEIRNMAKRRGQVIVNDLTPAERAELDNPRPIHG